MKIDIEKMVKEVAEKALDEYEYKGKTIRRYADMIDSGDLVKVVHCKDCKYWEFGDCYRQELTLPTDYCSYGEMEE